MIPSTEPKPSELAMKAAIAIFPHGYPNVSYCHDAEAIKQHQTFEALTIDRETNLPELLKQRDALKEALIAVIGDMAIDEPECYCYHAENGIESLAPCARCKAKAALALCDKAESFPQVISSHLWFKEGGEVVTVETTMDKDGKIHPAVKQ